MREAGLSSEEALRAATVEATLAIGRQGVLAPGGAADIIAVRGPVLEDVGLLRDVALVFAAGRRMK